MSLCLPLFNYNFYHAIIRLSWFMFRCRKKAFAKWQGFMWAIFTCRRGTNICFCRIFEELFFFHLSVRCSCMACPIQTQFCYVCGLSKSILSCWRLPFICQLLQKQRISLATILSCSTFFLGITSLSQNKLSHTAKFDSIRRNGSAEWEII